jgi:large subunit ribosomal protein L6
MPSESVITEAVEFPTEVKFALDDKKLKLTGPKGDITRDFSHARAVQIEKDKKKIILSINKPNRKNRAIIGTLRSHVKNMIDGVMNGPFVVRMKIVYAHFPISVKVENGKVFIENFLGERSPRVARIFGDNTEVLVEGEDVVIKNVDVEMAGQTAANIQKVTKIKDKDPRTFQDGIFKYQKFLGEKLIWKLKF